MTWQGGGSGAPGEPPEDDTRVDWSIPSNAAPPPPPPQPEAPGAGAGAYTYPAELAEQGPGSPPALEPAPLPEPVPVAPVAPVAPAPPAQPPAGTWGQPGAPEPPVGYPSAPGYAPGGAYPPGGGYPPAGYAPAAGQVPPAGTWQPPQAVYQPAPGSLKFGGVLPRLLAYLLDSFLVGIVVWFITGILGAVASGGFDSFVITSVLSTGLYALYFIGFWTGGGRATPGMRLFHLQIGQAADGRTLTLGQAVMRWVALGYPFTLLGIVPALGFLASGLLIIWDVILLATTAVSPTRQGLHDRIAGSAIVAPEGNEGPVIPCLVLAVVLLVVLPIIALIGMIALSFQIQQILTEVGGSL